MTLDVSKASELKLGKDLFLKVLLIGNAGTGKTTSAATAPGKKLLIDVDQGEASVRGVKDLDILRIAGPEDASSAPWQNLDKAQKEIKSLVKAGKFEYQTVILDSITRAYEYALSYAMAVDPARNAGGTPVSNHWMVQKRITTNFIEYFLNAPLHFVATVHAVAEKDELLGSITYQPAITGKDAERITRRFKDLYRCCVKPPSGPKEKAIFYWKTIPELQWPYLKSQINQGQKFWQGDVEPDFGKILKLSKLL